MRPDPVIPAFDEERCGHYLEGNEGAPPREQLMAALAMPWDERAPRRAIDVGCGPGREVEALVARGFAVTAVDPYARMLEMVRARVAGSVGAARVEFVHTTLEEHAPRLETAAFGLVHAGFALPFVVPAAFDAAFADLRRALAPGGLLVAQFFGPHDEFLHSSPAGSLSVHDHAAVRGLLAGMEVLAHDEVRRDGRMGRGRAKHWHVHHVIARASAPCGGG
ncbi:MAG: class I SAM-dependent methyltransferase [Planctomycetota bacterium]